MNDLVFNPLLPWVALIPLTVLLVTGCVVLAVRTSERRIPWLVRAAAVVVLALAFTRPGTPVTAVTERSEAALDVFVVIDVTASMIAEDWNGSSPRLEGVAEDVTALVGQAPEARYSLIMFAASSQTVLPLTTDDSALRSALALATLRTALPWPALTRSLRAGPVPRASPSCVRHLVPLVVATALPPHCWCAGYPGISPGDERSMRGGEGTPFGVPAARPRRPDMWKDPCPASELAGQGSFSGGGWGI